MHGLDEARNARFRALPQLHRLLETPEAAVMLGRFSRTEVVMAIRQALSEARAGLDDAGIDSPNAAGLLALAETALTRAACSALRRVINATGIALHTNLGRAPLAEEAVAAAVEAARGYCNLEYDLQSGTRGARLQGVEPLLCELTGAAAALAVNNGAAAILLALSGLAAGGEVVVSRGELVEIGGGFRIPDVIRQGGARLVEVGSTNKTRLADYAAAITGDTRVLLKVHQSNFRVVGFTAEASLAELAALARARGLLLVDDLGSGTLTEAGRGREPTVRAALAEGADLVTFSGDKLLGGPQAGLLAGTEAAVAPLRRHPLMRALRLDKVTLAALEATLRLHRDHARATERIPVLRMLSQTEAQLQRRAERLLASLAGMDARIVPTEGEAGGGSLPGEALPSRAVSVAGLPAAELARRLREGRPAVVGRIESGRVLLDVLAVADDEVDEVARAVRDAFA